MLGDEIEAGYFCVDAWGSDGADAAAGVDGLRRRFLVGAEVGRWLEVWSGCGRMERGGIMGMRKDGTDLPSGRCQCS